MYDICYRIIKGHDPYESSTVAITRHFEEALRLAEKAWNEDDFLRESWFGRIWIETWENGELSESEILFS